MVSKCSSDGIIENVRIGFANVQGVANRCQGVTQFMSTRKLDIFFLVETWLIEEQSFSNLRGVFTEMRLSKSELSVNAKRGKEGIIVLANEGVKSLISIVKKSVSKRWIVLKVADFYIACCYFPPLTAATNEEMFEFFSYIQEHKDIDYDRLVIVGDINARLGDMTGDDSINTRGTWLKKTILNHFALKIMPPIRGKWTTFSTSGRGVTDLVLCSEESVVQCNELSVYESIDLNGSDHRPLVWTVPLMKTFTLPTITRYNRGKLEKAEERKLYSDALHSSFFNIFSYFVKRSNDLRLECISNTILAQSVVDDLYCQFMHWIDDAALASIGLMHIDVGVSNHAFETDVIAKIRKDMEMVCGDIALLDPATVEYRSKFDGLHRVRDEYRRVLSERRYELFEEKCNLWAAPGNQSMFQKCISAIKKRESRSGCQLTPDKMEEYANHFRGTFGAQPKGVNVPLEVIEEMLKQISDEEKVECEEALSVFSAESIQTSLNFFSNGKAAGPDNIFVELVKHEETLTCQLLSILFKICYRFAIVPAMWCRANVTLIYKNKGDINDVANYRPISLTCVIRRVYERVLLRLLQPKTEHILTPNQGGFRPKRGTLHQSYVLDEIIKANPQAVFFFLDIKAAYDTVSTKLLWRDMVEYGVNRHLVSVCRSLFDFNVCNLVVNGKQSEDIRCLRGLLQGSSLSPLLFNLYIHSLILRLNKLPKLVTNGVEMNNLFYADDGGLFGEISVGQSLLDVCSTWGDEYGEDWSAPKSAAMMPLPPKKPSDVCVPKKPVFTIQGGEIPFVENFVYLGSEVKRGVGIVFENKQEERVRKMISTAIFLKRKGMNTHGWRISSSVCAYKSFLRPIMEYGTCFMDLKRDKMLETMSIAQNRVLNMIVSSACTSSRGAKLKMLNMETVAARCEYLQYCFVSNLRTRCPADSFATLVWRASVVEGENTSVRLRGRQKTSKSNTTLPELTVMQKRLIISNEIVQFAFAQGSDDKEAIESFVRKRKVASMASYDSVKNGKGDVAASIDHNIPRRLGRSAYTDRGVSREDQRVLIALRLGEFAFHQACIKCPEHEPVTREHASLCSGEAFRLRVRFPRLYHLYHESGQVCGSLLFQDYLLNRMDLLYTSRDAELYEEGQDILHELIASAKCIRESISGYVKNESAKHVVSWYHPLKKRKLATFILSKKQKPSRVRGPPKASCNQRAKPRALQKRAQPSPSHASRRQPRAKTWSVDVMPTPTRLTFDPP